MPPENDVLPKLVRARAFRGTTKTNRTNRARRTWIFQTVSWNGSTLERGKRKSPRSEFQREKAAFLRRAERCILFRSKKNSKKKIEDEEEEEEKEEKKKEEETASTKRVDDENAARQRRYRRFAVWLKTMTFPRKSSIVNWVALKTVSACFDRAIEAWCWRHQRRTRDGGEVRQELRVLA